MSDACVRLSLMNRVEFDSRPVANWERRPIPRCGSGFRVKELQRHCSVGSATAGAQSRRQKWDRHYFCARRPGGLRVLRM